MSRHAETIEGTLQADRLTLRLSQEAGIEPGKVLVFLRSAPTSSGPTMLEVLDRIHAEQRASGRRDPTDEEMAEEIARMRAEDDDYEERWRRLWATSGEAGEEAS